MTYSSEERVEYRRGMPPIQRRVVDERQVVTEDPAYVQREEVVQQTYVPPADAVYGERVVEDEATDRFTALDMGQRLIWFIVGLFLIDLGLRFFFKLAGANAGSGFVSFIYGTSNPLVAPFQGIFGTAASGGAVFEPVTLVAMVVYALIGWLLVALLGILLGGPSRGVREYRHNYRAFR